MIVIPMGMVYKYRNKFQQSALSWGKLNRSFINKNYQLALLSIVGTGVFIIIVIGFFSKNIKTCVSE